MQCSSLASSAVENGEFEPQSADRCHIYRRKAIKVRVCWEKTTGNVHAMKNLKKSEMIRKAKLNMWSLGAIMFQMLVG
ncbi:hypothetical protein L1987_08760 [Smallanthus sonchifolius]|uniref:Uncharacterized protein n=1 Tax=Smallanthus sonchifolius TaxID=185202 RepID=A0ACB9JN98_9ASTR|nr:hypothetical protein L1987_08760 [Smallanthus sonchifolius]